MTTSLRVNAEGTRLRIEALLRHGWTTGDVARHAGLDKGTPAAIRKGRRAVNRKTAVAVYGVYLAHRLYPVRWDDDDLDKPVPAFTFTNSNNLRQGCRPSVDVAEDLDDLAEQLGGLRTGTRLGWDVGTRRRVADRLGMSVSSFDRAVYRGRAQQRQLGSAA